MTQPGPRHEQREQARRFIVLDVVGDDERDSIDVTHLDPIQTPYAVVTPNENLGGGAAHRGRRAPRPLHGRDVQWLRTLDQALDALGVNGIVRLRREPFEDGMHIVLDLATRLGKQWFVEHVMPNGACKVVEGAEAGLRRVHDAVEQQAVLVAGAGNRNRAHREPPFEEGGGDGHIGVDAKARRSNQ